jgi:hypothetical protein
MGLALNISLCRLSMSPARPPGERSSASKAVVCTRNSCYHSTPPIGVWLAPCRTESRAYLHRRLFAFRSALGSLILAKDDAGKI